MGRRNHLEERGTEGLAGMRASGLNAIERWANKIVEALPVLDIKAVNAALEEVKEHPRASLHYLFEQFGSDDPKIRAVVGFLVSQCKGADVVDNLNAIIFDADQSPSTKVRANDTLAEVDKPVDADVLAMSVPDAEALRLTLPAQALRLLSDGDVAGAAAHARSLEPEDRYLIMYRAATHSQDTSLEFLRDLAGDNIGNALATVSAIGAYKRADGVELLQDLADSTDKSLQKVVKKTLFDLRKAGISVPDEKRPRSIATSSSEASDGELPIYRALVSDPSPNGLVLVVVARLRPKNRLKVFSVLVSLWKRGIDRAALRVDMSKSSFERFVASQADSKMPLKAATLDECRRIVARGVCVTRELGTPLPMDFGLGKPLLGEVDAEVAAFGNPFLCSQCRAELDDDTVKKIRDLAAYDNIPSETLCVACKKSPEVA